MAHTLYLLLLLASLALLGHSTSFQDAERAEYEEWRQMLRLYEEKRKVHEERVARGEDLSKVEPNTPWLKTCSGWVAQELCSTIFGSGLSEEKAINEDVGLLPLAANDFWINYEDKSAVARCKWENPANQTYKSIFREHIGCTLVEQLTEEELRAQKLGNLAPPAPLDPNLPWPVGEGFFPERVPEGVDLDCLNAVADDQFSQRLPNPRAMVVIYKGELVFERYAEGITKENRLIGWSATKSLTGSLIGIATRGGLNIYKPAPVPEWYETPNDPRQNITVDMMLRMSSGTRWVGDIGPTTECLFWSNNDCAHVCGLKPLVAEPDTEWNYNSGSSYLLSKIALEARAEKEYTPWEWPKKVLFHPIGAHSMYIEHQPNGMYLGGAYGYGTPRDWARFGLLHLRHGVWVDGKRILPEGWSQYARTATHTNPGYGAHFWRLNDVDDTGFYASGFRNQQVFILPNQDAVVVRQAMPYLAAHPVFDSREFITQTMKCFA